MGIIDLVVQIIKALAIYLQYRFDPKTIAKLETLAKEEKNEAFRTELEQAIAGSKPLSLSALLNARIAEFNRLRGKQESNSATRPSGDFLGTKLPEQPEPGRDVAVPRDAPGGLKPPK